MSTVVTTTRWTNPSLTKEEVEKAWSRARQEMDADAKLDTLRDRIHHTCLSIHNILGSMVGFTQVAKRTARYLPALLATFPATRVFAAGGEVENIRKAFQQVFDVATAIAEPILWFYAVTACVMMVTGRNKQMGWEKLKNVGYAYVLISCLPTIFAFFRWLARLLSGAMSF